MGLTFFFFKAEVKWQVRQSLFALIRRMPIFLEISLAFLLRGSALKVFAWVLAFHTATEDLWHSPQASGPFTICGSRRNFGSAPWPLDTDNSRIPADRKSANPVAPFRRPTSDERNLILVNLSAQKIPMPPPQLNR